VSVLRYSALCICTYPFPDICGNASGIFGGLLAFAFDNASGSSGLSGWQWCVCTLLKPLNGIADIYTQAISHRRSCNSCVRNRCVVSTSRLLVHPEPEDDLI
jgi:hypothetical protein